MYNKVLVPLDKSKEAEKVLPVIRPELAPEGEVVLLHVIPFFKAERIGEHIVPGHQLEEAERSKAMDYLQGLARALAGEMRNCRPEVVTADSVAEGVTDFAQRENVDLIAMYTHDRKGLARLIRGSIAKEVSRRAPIEVQVFKPQELIGADSGGL
ncbi:MAG: universal stress protein [Dehalococcoidia bacterium]